MPDDQLVRAVPIGVRENELALDGPLDVGRWDDVVRVIVVVAPARDGSGKQVNGALVGDSQIRGVVSVSGEHPAEGEAALDQDVLDVHLADEGAVPEVNAVVRVGDSEILVTIAIQIPKALHPFAVPPAVGIRDHRVRVRCIDLTAHCAVKNVDRAPGLGSDQASRSPGSRPRCEAASPGPRELRVDPREPPPSSDPTITRSSPPQPVARSPWPPHPPCYHARRAPPPRPPALVSRRRGLASSAPPALAPLVAAFAAGLIGWGLAPWIYAHLAGPIPLDTAVWTVIVPGRDEGMADASLASGTGLVDGGLLLSTRTFGRSDILIPRDTRPVGTIDLLLGPDSAPLFLNVHQDSGGVSRFAELAPGGWRSAANGTWRPYGTTGAIQVVLRGGVAQVNGVAAGQVTPGTLELIPNGGAAKLQAIRLTDTRGEVILDARFGLPEPGVPVRASVALLFAVLAACVGRLMRASPISGAVASVIALAPVVGVLLTPYSTWRAFAERLYLLHTSASSLRTYAFGALLVPILAMALLATGVLVISDGGRTGGAKSGGRTGGAEGGRTLPTAGIAALLLVVAALASRDLSGLGWLGVLPGLAFLALPWRTARAAEMPMAAVLARDAPALAILAVATWGPGLLPAVLWRLLCVWADVPLLLHRSARAGADAAFFTLALLPVALELGVRSTYLLDAWDPVRLAGTSTGEAGRSPSFSAFWEGSCGAGAQRIYTFGGSSAGGAYQFGDDPKAFFPARLHDRLCARGLSVVSSNFGNSGRDSWDVANAVDGLYAEHPPALAVLYLGVNDLLTQDSPLSRKERAAKLAALGAAASQLDAWTSSIRLITGLSFLVKAPTPEAALVTAVPIRDAEENLRRIHAATIAAGGSVLLVTEYTQSHVDTQLNAYWQLERRLAAELERTRFVDLREELGANGANYLLDRNHLTKEGSGRVAEVLEPVVVEMVGG